MHNLLNFLIKNTHWFVFIFLEVICFYFIFSHNSYQRSVFLNSSNEISGNVYAASANVRSYFGLRSDNVELLEKTGELSARIEMLENYIFELEKDSLKTIAFLNASNERENDYIAARVINNSVSQTQNFITINKGSKDGITVGMGVISHDGVVGEVRAVSHNFSVVQSLLNSDSKFSSKLTKSNAFAPLEWIERDPRYATIREYPSHEHVAKGDTVVTSGYSDVFPNGVMVGIVEDFQSQSDVNQYTLKIKLSTDFNALKNVLVIKREHLDEKRELENKVKNAKN